MTTSRYFVSLRTYALAFAVVLSPAFLQVQSCGIGDTRLASLGIEVLGENRIAFDPSLRVYEVGIPAGTTTVTVRARPMDTQARVTWYVPDGTGVLDSGIIGVGGGAVTVDLPPDGYSLYVGVFPPGGAVDTYIATFAPCSSDCSDENDCTADVCDPANGACSNPNEVDGVACDFGRGMCASGTCEVQEGFFAGASVTVSGDSVFAQCTADSPVTGTFAADSEVESWIAVNPTDPDHLAVVWQQDKYLSGGGCRGHIVSVSFDGGGTWAPSTIPGLTPCSGGAWDRTTDPWLAFAANGDLYAASASWSYLNTGGAIVVNRSTDGGLTWGDPVIVDETTQPLLNDRETMTADPVDPCTIYVTWTRFSSARVVPGDVLFSRTTDCGATWTSPTIVQSSDPAGIASQIVVLPDGDLLAFFRETTFGGPRPIYVERSTDGGLTWPDDPVVIADAIQSRVISPDGALVRSSAFDVAVNRRSGELYVVWERAFGSGLQAALSSSSDGGLTWSPPVRIDDTPPNAPFTLEQAFMPSVEVSDDGTIGVTYYNFENDVAGALPSLSDYWFVSCDPELVDCGDGPSWSAAVRLTPESFDYALAPLVSGNNSGLFLGDYVGLAAAGDDFFAFFSVTTNTDPANAIFVPIRRQ